MVLVKLRQYSVDGVFIHYSEFTKLNLVPHYRTSCCIYYLHYDAAILMILDQVTQLLTSIAKFSIDLLFPSIGR